MRRHRRRSRGRKGPQARSVLASWSTNSCTSPLRCPSAQMPRDSITIDTPPLGLERANVAEPLGPAGLEQQLAQAPPDQDQSQGQGAEEEESFSAAAEQRPQAPNRLLRAVRRDRVAEKGYLEDRQHHD